MILLLLIMVLFYGSFKFTYSYFAKTDAQICQISNGTLINGQCHSECNFPVKDKRNTLLIGGIAFSIFAILIVIYGMILLKTKFGENGNNRTYS